MTRCRVGGSLSTGQNYIEFTVTLTSLEFQVANYRDSAQLRQVWNVLKRLVTSPRSYASIETANCGAKRTQTE